MSNNFIPISEHECGKKTKILKDKEGHYLTSIAFCKKLTCPHCLEMAKANLEKNLNGYVLQYKLRYMLTLTTQLFDNTTELNKWFSKIRNLMNQFYNFNYFCSKNKSLKVIKEGTNEDKKQYYINWKYELIEKEALLNTIIYGKYNGYLVLHNLFIYLRQQQLLDSSFVKNLIDQYADLLTSREIRKYKKDFKVVIKKVTDMEKGEITQIFFNNFNFFRILFYNYIQDKKKLTKQYKDLIETYKNDFLQINDKDFSYIRVIEYQKFKDKQGKRRPHFHTITNLYVLNYFCLLNVQANSFIWDNGYTSKLNDNKETNEQDTTQYILKYITKDTMSYLKDSRDFDISKIIVGSKGISVALTYKTKDDEGYKLIDTIDGLSYLMDSKFNTKEEAINSIFNRKQYESNYILDARNTDMWVFQKIEDILKSELTKTEKHDLLSEIGTLKNKMQYVMYNDIFFKAFNSYKKYLNEPLPGELAVVFDETPKYGVLSSEQKQALDGVMNNPISLITGGAGTGKTQIIKQICETYANKNIYCVSFSGKAVSVMKQRINYPNVTFMTVHKFIKAILSKGLNTCFYSIYNKRDLDILIVDEVSMLSSELLALLLEANGGYKTIFVGDINQLPPVSVTNPLLYLPYMIPTFRLNENHRSNGLIRYSAKAVLNRRLNMLTGDIMLNEEPNYAEYIKEGYQVLVSSNKKKKAILKEVLKDKVDIILNDYKKFNIGDKVLLTFNDYDKDINNGDIFTIKEYKPNTSFVLERDNKIVELSYFEFCNYAEPTQALTVHKSQGSEYDRVLLILDTQNALRSYNLLYTGITRAKEELKIYDLIQNAKEKPLSNFGELPMGFDDIVISYTLYKDEINNLCKKWDI